MPQPEPFYICLCGLRAVFFPYIACRGGIYVVCWAPFARCGSFAADNYAVNWRYPVTVLLRATLWLRRYGWRRRLPYGVTVYRIPFHRPCPLLLGAVSFGGCACYSPLWITAGHFATCRRYFPCVTTFSSGARYTQTTCSFYTLPHVPVLRVQDTPSPAYRTVCACCPARSVPF